MLSKSFKGKIPYSEHTVYKNGNIFYIVGENGDGKPFIRKYEFVNKELVELPDSSGYFLGNHDFPSQKFRKFNFRFYAGNRNWADGLTAILLKNKKGFFLKEYTRSKALLKVSSSKKGLITIKEVKPF